VSTALYCRVSTVKQDVAAQVKMLKDYCSNQGISKFKIYSDVGISGVRDSRPQLDLLLKEVRLGSIRTILLTKLDRLGRSLKHLLNLLAEFKNRNVRLVSIADGIDTSNDSPMNRAFWQLLGIFAELEREIIRSRVLGGLDRARASGRRLGRPVGAGDKRKRATSGYCLRYAGRDKESRKLGKRSPTQGVD